MLQPTRTHACTPKHTHLLAGLGHAHEGALVLGHEARRALE